MCAGYELPLFGRERVPSVQRPEAHQCPSDDVVGWNWPPTARVVTGATVIAEHEVAAFRHGDPSHVPGVAVGYIWLVQRYAVHYDTTVPNLYRVARHTDDPFHEIALRIIGKLEDYHLASSRGVERKHITVVSYFHERYQRHQVPRVEPLVDEFVDDDVLALCQVWQHAGALDPVVAHAELQPKENEQCQDYGFEQLSDNGPHVVFLVPYLTNIIAPRSLGPVCGHRVKMSFGLGGPAIRRVD